MPSPRTWLRRCVGVARLLPAMRCGSFCNMRWWNACSRREGIFSFKQRRAYKRSKYHPAQQCPHNYNRFPRDKNMHKGLPDEGRKVAGIIVRKGGGHRKEGLE
jgi:hypothetical protein